MVGMGEISALAGSLKAASDLAKAMVSLRDTQIIQAKAIELQSAILSAQGDAMSAMTAHSDLIEEVRSLEAKLAAFEDWETQKQRYELKEYGGGRVLAYALKDGVEPPEHVHSICPDCYQQRKKSILQKMHHFVGRAESLKCQVCGWEGYTQGHARPEHAPPGRR